LVEESVAGRIARYARASAMVRRGLEALGFELFLPPSLRATTLTAVKLPALLKCADLHRCAKQNGFVIYAGLGPGAEHRFRVARMGDVAESEYHRFIRVVA